jgi:hypothetical protein
MTPFMLRVRDAVADGPRGPNAPALADSIPRTIGQGVHEQVELRSLAEQLVAEANAVLGSLTGEPILLQDHSGTRDQAFTLSYGRGWATIMTSFQDQVALARLAGPAFAAPNKELPDGEALADLLLALVTAGRGTPAGAGA